MLDFSHSATKQEILILLKNSGGMTVDQLKDHLGISAMGVRQHLAVLERDGLIESGKRRGHMGRPARIYTLTEKGNEIFPRSYDTLAIALLETLSAMDGEEKVDLLFRKLMEKTFSSHAARLSDKNLPERVEELARIQQEAGFMAEFGKRPGGYYVTQHNCTMAKVAERFPFVCRYERMLFESLLGAKVKRERCIAKGDTCCSYFVENRPEKASLESETLVVQP